jgi:glycyl-tRNA synthetase beta chain
MNAHHDFLVEIHTEELPPKALKKLSLAFEQGIKNGLKEQGLEHKDTKSFATPRRIAVLVSHLIDEQKTQSIARKGPALTQAYDADNNPTPAALGFAKSCGIELSEMATQKTDKGEWLYFESEKPGKKTTELLSNIVKQALNKLPIAKPMRWGNYDEAFVRPVHSIIMLYGEAVVDAEFFGLKAGQQTQGHRFLSKNDLVIGFAGEYENILENKGFVIANFESRKTTIKENIEAKVMQHFNGKAKAVIEPNLLDEVTALVEWPEVVICEFDKEFLDVPKEALVSSMQEHQKYFSLVDSENNLLPYFITVSNIVSQSPEMIINGNERVMRARLSDAQFFYQSDKKSTLESHVDALKNVTYQHKLGSVFDKTQRVEKTVKQLAKVLKRDDAHVTRAAQLCKADLTTLMVGEFPDLQGTMGRYYALNDKEDAQVALTIYEHYLPRSANDDLPTSLDGALLAIADRIDTLIGIFGINQQPTGDKDPFALRRAALGLLKIVLAHKLNYSLDALISQAVNAYPSEKLENKNISKEVLTFLIDRFKVHAKELGFDAAIFQSVAKQDNPYDMLMRMQAVKGFKEQEACQSLAGANKRVSNLLAKQKQTIDDTVDETLFIEGEEKALSKAINENQKLLSPLINKKDYAHALNQLASLKDSVDAFFDKVMVMADDEKLKNNRLALLKQLRGLFLQVADIAELQ